MGEGFEERKMEGRMFQGRKFVARKKGMGCR